MKLIAGLGNPEEKYAKTRHNIGWMVIDYLNNLYKFDKINYQGIQAHWYRWPDKDVSLLKPTCGMNDSGVPIATVDALEHVWDENVLIICDDVSLPFGKFRLRAQGSSGHHKGLQSVFNHLCTEKIARLRIGVGKPNKSVSMYDYVLSDMTDDEISYLYTTVFDKIDMVINAWLDNNIDVAMTFANDPKLMEN